MAKMPGSICAVCLVASILVNVYFVMNPYMGRSELSWARRAAEEAEEVAGISCSGHGRAYVDGVRANGRPVCECNGCFGGPDCSQIIPGCSADVDSGDPLFLEPYWMQNAASSAVVVSGSHRMGYGFPNPNRTYISQELERYIRKVHGVAKNAVTDGKYIVFGCGSTQIINAAVYALSQNLSSRSEVVATKPYYPLYREQTEYFETPHYEFEGDTSMVNNNSSALDLIEFVTSPNNPDGQLKKPVLHGQSVKTIYDHAYYWPHFTAIPSAMDEDVMIFTLSKLTGHAGSRFGWAILKDKNVYDRMYKYIDEADMGISRDTQLRAWKLLKSLLAGGNGIGIFDFAYRTMNSRWTRLNQVVSASRRFSLQEIPPEFCHFFNRVRGPSPAYGWLKCEYEEDTDCAQVLRDAKIIARRGSLFGVEDRFVRLSLIKRKDDFDLLLYRMNQLIRKEVNASEAL